MRVRVTPGSPVSRLAIPPHNRIELAPWDESGLDLLRAMNTPEQKRYLGGPETDAKIADRHRRYLTYHTPGDTEMLRILVGSQTAGSVGYWPITRPEGDGYEMGWELKSAFHGQGIGSAATRLLLQRLAPVARHPFVYAFPTPDNAGSNGIARKLGFVLTGIEDFEYPKGTVSPHNVWRLDLSSFAPPA